jgi:hypothetical protein
VFEQVVDAEAEEREEHRADASAVEEEQEKILQVVVAHACTITCHRRAT